MNQRREALAAEGVAPSVSLAEGMRGCPIPMFAIDRQHRITHWNQALESFSGLAAAAMLGTRAQWMPFYSAERPVLADLILDGACGERIATYYGDKIVASPLIADAFVGEDLFQDAAGQRRWLAFTAAPLRGPDGALVGALETLQDITERKDAELRERQINADLERLVRQRTAELHAANEELGEYAHVVSHDLRAPLRAIRNYVDFLGKDLAPHLGAPQRLYFDGLHQAIGQGHALVADLLEYAQIGQERVESRAVAPAALLADLLPAMALPAQASVRVAADLPAVVGDPLLLRQAFQNLIANALKFNDAATPQVDIGWQSAAAGRVELFVRDNGIGIDAANLDQIFKVFQRLHTSDEFPGTGIGLAIVRKAVLRMGGELRVESAPRRGSTFFVTLPLAGEGTCPSGGHDERT